MLMKVSSLAAENSWIFHFHAKEIPLRATSRKIEQVVLSSYMTNADNCNLLFSIVKGDNRILVFSNSTVVIRQIIFESLNLFFK